MSSQQLEKLIQLIKQNQILNLYLGNRIKTFIPFRKKLKFFLVLTGRDQWITPPDVNNITIFGKISEVVEQSTDTSNETLSSEEIKKIKDGPCCGSIENNIQYKYKYKKAGNSKDVTKYFKPSIVKEAGKWCLILDTRKIHSSFPKDYFSDFTIRYDNPQQWSGEIITWTWDSCCTFDLNLIDQIKNLSAEGGSCCGDTPPTADDLDINLKLRLKGNIVKRFGNLIQNDGGVQAVIDKLYEILNIANDKINQFIFQNELNAEFSVSNSDNTLCVIGEVNNFNCITDFMNLVKTLPNVQKSFYTEEGHLIPEIDYLYEKINDLTDVDPCLLENPEIKSIEIQRDDGTTNQIYVGDKLKLKVIATYTNGTTRNLDNSGITWLIDDSARRTAGTSTPQYISVDNNGVVTGLIETRGCGVIAEVDSLFGKIRDHYMVEVLFKEEKINPPTNIVTVIDVDNHNSYTGLVIGSIINLKAFYNDIDITTEAKWVSSNKTVELKLNNDGYMEVHALYAGNNTIITATSNGVSGNYQLSTVANAEVGIDVTPPVTLSSILVEPSDPTKSSISIYTGDTVQFKATATYSDGTTLDITNDPDTEWYLKNDLTTVQCIECPSAIYSYTTPGLITGIAPGSPQVCARVRSLNVSSNSFSITVNPRTIDPKSLIDIGISTNTQEGFMRSTVSQDNLQDLLANSSDIFDLSEIVWSDTNHNPNPSEFTIHRFVDNGSLTISSFYIALSYNGIKNSDGTLDTSAHFAVRIYHDRCGEETPLHDWVVLGSSDNPDSIVGTINYEYKTGDKLILKYKNTLPYSINTTYKVGLSITVNYPLPSATQTR